MAQPRPPDTSTSGMRPPATCPGLGLCTILPLLPRVVGPQAPGPLRHCGHGAPPPPGPRAGSRAGSATDLCASPLVASSIMMTTSAVRATAITCRPRPFPGQGGGGGHAVTRAGRCGAQTPVLTDLPWTLPHATPGWHVSRTPCCLAHGDVLQEETGLTTRGGTVCTPHPESRRGASPHQRPLNPPSCAAQSVWSACRT